MLRTEKQLEWKQYMEADIRGEALDLEPGYADAFQAFKEQSKDLLPSWNAERRVEEFLRYLRAITAEKKTELIAKSLLLPKTKEELRALTQKEQTLLVSKNGGKDFDTVMTLEQFQANPDPLKLTVLSPALISSSLNGVDIFEEQCILHVIGNLEQSGFLVQDAYMKDHTVCVQALAPKKPESQEVLVDIGGEPLAVLDYRFQSGGKEEHVQETLLAEEFGIAESDPSLVPPTIEEVLSHQTKRVIESEVNAESDVAKIAGLAAGTGLLLMGNKPTPKASEMAKNTRESMRFPILKMNQRNKGLDMMAAKAAVAARFAEDQINQTKAAELQEERIQKYEKDRAKAYEKKKKIEKERNKRNQQAQASRHKAAGVGAILTGAAFGGTITGVPILLQIISQ